MHSVPNQIKHHQAKRQESRIHPPIAVRGKLGRAKAKPQNYGLESARTTQATTATPPHTHTPLAHTQYPHKHIQSHPKGGYPNSHLNGSLPAVGKVWLMNQHSWAKSRNLCTYRGPHLFFLFIFFASNLSSENKN